MALIQNPPSTRRGMDKDGTRAYCPRDLFFAPWGPRTAYKAGTWSHRDLGSQREASEAALSFAGLEVGKHSRDEPRPMVLARPCVFATEKRWALLGVDTRM